MKQQGQKPDSDSLAPSALDNTASHMGEPWGGRKGDPSQKGTKRGGLQIKWILKSQPFNQRSCCKSRELVWQLEMPGDSPTRGMGTTHHHSNRTQMEATPSMYNFGLRWD